jgi:hypothetical protein
LTFGDPSRAEVQVGEKVEVVDLLDASVRQRPLQAGMTIRVPERENTLFIIGEVAQAGAYGWQKGRCETLMDALTAAIEFLQPGGSTSSRAAATAVELQFAL